MTSSTTLSSSIFWSGPLGPQVTRTSSLLGSQHVAVISDGALPTLWQMLRRFLIVLEVNETPTAVPSAKNSGSLEECDTYSLAGKHQKSEKEESLPVPFARVVVRVRVSPDVIVPCGHTHCAARWSPSINFFSDSDGRQSEHARVHRQAHASHSAVHSLSTICFYLFCQPCSNPGQM